tara:strand:- start:711 stop:1139 length:429 start_codon:yes stop_codon:yes gene_type:complete
MHKITYSLLVLILSSSMFSCRKNTDSYIIFKNSNYNEINDDDVTVDLNSNFDLIINSGFPQKNNRPNYFMKINQNMEVLLDDSSQYYYRESQGWNGPEGVYTEQVRVLLDFNEDVFNSGDTIQIICNNTNPWIERKKLFIVK